MILTKSEILNQIKNNRINITPYKKANIGPASVDLTLANKFRIIKTGIKNININEKTNYKKYTKLITSDKIILKPAEFILGITKEIITLPEDICGWLSGRTRFARLGLLVHATASFVQPGVNNRQVLEIRNLSNINLILKPGTRICQMIFEKTQGKAKYSGKFKKQKL